VPAQEGIFLGFFSLCSVSLCREGFNDSQEDPGLSIRGKFPLVKDSL
jgi:hypothetical protein